MKKTLLRSLPGSFMSRGLNLRLCCVLCWMVATVSLYADSTISITVPPGGYALIANELANGNTLDSILPNVPGGTSAGNAGTLLLERNCVNGTFSTYFYKSGGVGGVGWRLSTSPSTPAGSLVPGQGAIIQNRTTTNYTYTITGAGYSPVLPQSFSCGCGNYYLLSGQTNIPAAYEDIVGLPPLEGTRLFRYNSGSATVPFPPQAPNYTVYTYLGGTWTPGIPVAATGESVWIYPPCSTNSSCLVLDCPTNFTIACGTNWDFGTPFVLSNCCTNVTSVSTTVTNGVFCPQTVTRSWLFTDACGDSSICSQTVTVVDTTPQIIACASNKTVCSSCLLSTSLPSYTVLWDFVSGSGVYPIAALAQGSDGSLYGTTAYTAGGFSGAGVVFSINPDGSSYTPAHTFTGSTDAKFPQYGTLLVGNDGALYGTTTLGGNFQSGALFRMSPDGTSETILHSFISGGTDGYIPEAGVVQDSDGTLYGTTQNGGINGVGAVFSVKTDGTDYNLVYEFNSSGADGHNPYAGVVIGPGGMLYGTTLYGGNNGVGTVFRLNINGTETVLHSFSGGGSDGSSPYGGLLLGTDGMLYGTTYAGGSGGVGTVFRLDTSGGNYSVLHNFNTADGANPYATLVQGCDRLLYGTTYQGGANGAGTVFRVNTDGTGCMVLHNFGGANGQYPYGGLMIGTDGSMYGTTSAGGANGLGTIFKLGWPAAWSFDAPTISDPCSNYTLSVVSTVTTGNCPQYSTRTWLLTDTCGNTNTCSQTVTAVCSNCCVAPPASMSAWWTFDEASGVSTAQDIIGSVDNIAVYHGNPTAEPGIVNNALCFDGTNDYLVVTNQAEVNFSGTCASGAESFTIDAWIKPNPAGPSYFQVLLDKRTGLSDLTGYVLILNPAPEFMIGDGLSPQGYYYSNSPDLRDGNWHFIAVTVARCESDSNLITFYVDGSVTSTYLDYHLGSLNNTADLQIGRWDKTILTCDCPNYMGCLDELEIYKRALSTNELAAIYSAGSFGKCRLPCPPSPPAPGIHANSTKGVSPLNVSFWALPTPCGPTLPGPHLHWDFGDGNITNVINNTGDPISHTYGSGTFTVTLIATDDDGNSATNIQPNFIIVQTPFQEWQLSHFNCTNCPQAAASADPDGDGQNNLAEFLAGTDPNNSASAFEILSVIDDPQDGVGIVTWLTTGGHTNFVQASSGGPNGSYTTNFTDISGPIVISGSGDTITNYTDVGGATNRPSRYYRIRLAP